MKKGGIDGLRAYVDKLDRYVSIVSLKNSTSNDYNNEWISEEVLPPMTFLARDELVFKFA